MRLIKAGLYWAPLGRIALYGGMFLLLAASLTGFFLLINFLVEMVSLGPRDLVAPTSSQDEHVSLPSGVGAVVFAVSAISVILGGAILIALRGWKWPGLSTRFPWGLLLGGLVAGLTVGAGLYLSSSGFLGVGITYDQHQAQRSFLEPAGLALLGLVFISIAFVGIVIPRFLLPLLAVLLLSGFGLGLLNLRDLDGLHLFNRSSELEKPLAYAMTVEEYRRVKAPSTWESTRDSSGIPGNRAVIPESLRDPLDPIISLPLPYGTILSLESPTSAEQRYESEIIPVFKIFGAVHTRYLRTGTGDVYIDGEWRQMDLLRIHVEANKDFVDRSTGALLDISRN